jgi:hypothetical protein
MSASSTLRLVALWGLSEAFLGGILHALKLPLTGLLVGGAALILIHLLGEEAPRRGTVLRGLLVVLSIKALLSPHSPLTAYLAVAFQGILGELLSWIRPAPRLRGLVLGVVTMLESAGQQVLVLWLLAGKPLAVAFNAFMGKLLGQQQPDYALALVILWLLAHALAGAALGWWAGGLRARLPLLARQHPELVLNPQEAEAADATPGQLSTGGTPARPQRRWRPNRVLLGVWLLLAVAWLGSTLGWWPAGPLGKKGLGSLLLRSALIYGAWALLVAPLLLQGLRRWLTGPHRGRWATDLQTALELLPTTRLLVQACWRRTAGRQGLARLRLMVLALGLNILVETPPPAPLLPAA